MDNLPKDSFAFTLLRARYGTAKTTKIEQQTGNKGVKRDQFINKSIAGRVREQIAKKGGIFKDISNNICTEEVIERLEKPDTINLQSLTLMNKLIIQSIEEQIRKTKTTVDQNILVESFNKKMKKYKQDAALDKIEFLYKTQQPYEPERGNQFRVNQGLIKQRLIAKNINTSK